jgi:hypothetical protein
MKGAIIPGAVIPNIVRNLIHPRCRRHGRFLVALLLGE